MIKLRQETNELNRMKRLEEKRILYEKQKLIDEAKYIDKMRKKLKQEQNTINMDKMILNNTRQKLTKSKENKIYNVKNKLTKKKKKKKKKRTM